MKSLLIIAFFTLSFKSVYSQEFKVVFLIDKVYDKTVLNSTLESMNGLSLIGQDYVQFKMISNSENEVKLPHDNGEEGKKLKKSNVIGMAGVRCNPCKRLMAERKSSGKTITYALTSDNDFGTCNMGVDDYEALSSNDDLEEILKKERKKAKKLKDDYKVIFWLPSNQTVSIDLMSDNQSQKVDFGTLINFTASTNSKEYIPVIMKINDELVDPCKETGSYKINRTVPLSLAYEITETTKVTLEGKGCGDVKELTFEVSGKCDEIEKVVHEIYYESKAKGSLAKKVLAKNTLDGIECAEIQLVDNKYYIIVLNKQCGVKEYRAEFEDVQSKKRFSATLRKSSEQANVHLNSTDKDEFSVFTLNHDDLKSKGLFDLRSDDTEPKYKMRIIPTEAVKSSLDLKGNESVYQTVKFQKCN
jgi:hypothetical protein